MKLLFRILGWLIINRKEVRHISGGNYAIVITCEIPIDEAKKLIDSFMELNKNNDNNLIIIKEGDFDIKVFDLLDKDKDYIENLLNENEFLRKQNIKLKELK